MAMQKRKLIIPFLVLVLIIYIPIRILSPKKTTKPQVKATKVSIITLTPTITLTLTPTPTATPTPTLTPAPTATPSPTFTPTPLPPSGLDELFTKFASEYSIDKELLKRIANCESSLNPSAGTNKYAGLFQFAEPIWTQTRNLMGQNPDINLRFDAQEAIRTAAFMLSQNHLGIWPVCGK
ncbi:hypothetical protein C4559_01835 [Candidatus Microgenomates bacterium]|nr:MAG: hypothetical protein C4559_01835 [Candidatus Microgenomates bacterium]